MAGKNLALANGIAERNAFYIEQLRLLGQQNEDQEGFQNREELAEALRYICFIRAGGKEEKFRQDHPDTYKMLEAATFEEEERLARGVERVRGLRRRMQNGQSEL